MLYTFRSIADEASIRFDTLYRSRFCDLPTNDLVTELDRAFGRAGPYPSFSSSAARAGIAADSSKQATQIATLIDWEFIVLSFSPFTNYPGINFR
jgi:hypothetical protein